MRGTEDWKRAVVHIEGAADSLSFEERQAALKAMSEALKTPGLTDEEISLTRPKSRDLRFRGTAIFLSQGGRRYLLTARHVVRDERVAERESSDESRGRLDEEKTQERARDWIFPIIFRVPNLDEILSGGLEGHREFLMNLRAGVPWMTPYTFSDPALDLAVISIDQRDSRFGDDLEKAGYQSITLDDFADGPSVNGAEIYTVGYPDAVAVLGTLPLHPARISWSSTVVSLPAFSFGRVAMLRDELPQFWCDFTVSPGNSGGPVIEDGKLVGILSGQAIEENVRIPFALAFKASFLLPLLEEQTAKDRR